MEQQAESGHVHGCLLANLSQELTGSVIEIQLCVESIYADWAAILAKIFAGDKNAKALPPERQLEFANVVLSYMNGAILMAKVKNDPQQIVTLGEQFLPYFVKSERTKKKRTKANVYAQ